MVGAAGIGYSAKTQYDSKNAVEVEIKKVERKDLRSILSASGRIRPKTMVDISAAVSGKVLELLVRDGDPVEKGQLLLRIDPKPFQTQVQQLEASLESAKANIELQEANLRQSEANVSRSKILAEQGLLAKEQVEREETMVDVERARLKATEHEIPRLEASLDEARHELTKVDVHSDIAGTVTALNIEAGEFAFVGAFNNPATVLLTVADLEVIEAEVEVDETEAVQAKPGQRVELEVDAHADWVFDGVVTEVGHNPVTKQTGAEREGTSYLVTIAVEDKIPGVRPGLTCSAKVHVDERSTVLALPIQALILRKIENDSSGTTADDPIVHAVEPPPPPPDPTTRDQSPIEQSGAQKRKDEEGKIEGVFVVKDMRAIFRPVRIGITGEKDFELLSGLEEGEEIVAGPFKALRTLKSGDRIRLPKKKKDADEGQ